MSEQRGDGRGLSERDRFWLEHHEAQVASGQSGKEYVAAHDLSLDAFYQGRKRLRAIGVLPPARAEGAKATAPVASSREVRFAKVAVSAPRAEGPRLRIELANGIAMEWSDVTEADPIVELIERIRALP
jgi:hypothetical protein